MEQEIIEQVEDLVEEDTVGNIKEIEFSLNTMTSGSASFLTQKINGILEGILISCMNQVQITIKLGEFDITVFEVPSFHGEKFIPMRLGAVSNSGESFRDAPAKWALNDSLRIEVKGQFNSEIKFMVRYK